MGRDQYTIILGADHAGFRLKERLSEFLKSQGHTVQDIGCYSEDSVDYPRIGATLAEAIQPTETNGDTPRFGVLCCGSGIGISMSANRHPWIRAVVAHDHNTAIMSRRHNDANVICFGGRVIAPELACDILETFLKTPFDGGRHQQRVDMLTRIVVKHQDNKEGLPSC